MSDNTELLLRIADSLDRIEEILLQTGTYGNENKTLEIKETRILMQDIVKHYRETEPRIKVEIGSKLHVFGFKNAITKVKNIPNTKFEQRRIFKYIRKLEEYQFITKANADSFEVLDTGVDWGDLE